MSYGNYKKGVEITKKLYDNYKRYYRKDGGISKERIEEMEKKLNIKFSNQVYDSLYENNVLELVLDKAENKFEAFLKYLKNKNDTFYQFVMILTNNNNEVIITDDTKTRRTWSEDEIKKWIENIKKERDKFKVVIIFNNMKIEEKNKNSIKVLMEYEGGEAYEMTIEISIFGKIKKLVFIDDFYNKQKIENFIWTK